MVRVQMKCCNENERVSGVQSMRASCSSMLEEEFDDFNEKNFYSSANNSISLINDIQNNDLPFFDDFSEEFLAKKDSSTESFASESLSSPKTLTYDPQLATLIENELGLHDCQTSRKNAWGNLSYAELIAKAIEHSSHQRLTLSQIYSFMILYVPYFRDKADKKSSTGWKVGQSLPVERHQLLSLEFHPAQSFFAQLFCSNSEWSGRQIQLVDDRSSSETNSRKKEDAIERELE